ncbi:lipoamide acyltransferase component of branched-chain alpha-keto acid dehydrogenase complex, mitochondrial-like [Bidens hawaiensis]|uniref:lipoamide acyltransferase component of branched-chain alpha-keto acid dehydrogenase complex, mitochondrial-like n=1 Tax=Bidens hawaiensis TaxID=980011 RepID=UPI0040496E07
MLARRVFQKRSCWRSGNYARRSLPPPTAEATRVIPRAVVHFSSVSRVPMKSTFDCSYKLYNNKVHYFATSAAVLERVDNIVDIPLAQTGEGIAECELLKWFVKEGDEVEEYQRLCEVQSDKATIEITSRYQGRVVQFLHVPGDIVKVGETLLSISVDDSQVPSNNGNQSSPTSQPIEPINESSEPKTTQESETLSLTTPAVRNLAKQHDIDVNDVPGTGKHGRIQKEDVLNYVSSLKNKPSVVEPTLKPEQIIQPMVNESLYQDKTLPIRGYQRAMVKSMTAAASIPHFHFIEEIKCDELCKLKDVFQKQNSDPSVKFTFLPILIKSLSMALAKYPLLNSTFNLEKYEVNLKGSHNIGIAMATPVGLVVPNIKNVQSLSILEITKELARLQTLAKENKLNPEDIRGGTITLSNVGSIGGKSGSPLINVPEVAIIALGRTQKVACFDDDGNAYPVSSMTANIAADHRILDGATVAQFCNEWKRLIEKPELILLHTR